MVPVRVVIAVMIPVMIAIMVTIPVAFAMPLMFVTVPPSVMLVPTALPLGSQVTPPVIRLPAELAMLADRAIEFGLRLLNSLLALCPIVRMHTRHCHKQPKHAE